MYIGQWPSVPFKVGTVGPHTALPNTVSCPVIFSWISLVVWNLITFKGDFSFGKMQKLVFGKMQGTKSGLWGTWVTWVIWCFTKKLCTRSAEWAHCRGEAAGHQLPIAAAFWIIWIVSVEECWSFTQNLMLICCSTCSDILNVMATQYACSVQGCLLPLLTGTVKSSLFTHAHSSPLSLAARLHRCCTNHSHYINNSWTFSRQTSYSVLIHLINFN